MKLSRSRSVEEIVGKKSDDRGQMVGFLRGDELQKLFLSSSNGPAPSVSDHRRAARPVVAARPGGRPVTLRGNAKAHVKLERLGAEVVEAHDRVLKAQKVEKARLARLERELMGKKEVVPLWRELVLERPYCSLQATTAEVVAIGAAVGVSPERAYDLDKALDVMTRKRRRRRRVKKQAMWSTTQAASFLRLEEGVEEADLNAVMEVACRRKHDDDMVDSECVIRALHASRRLRLWETRLPLLGLSSMDDVGQSQAMRRELQSRGLDLRGDHLQTAWPLLSPLCLATAPSEERKRVFSPSSSLSPKKRPQTTATRSVDSPKKGRRRAPRLSLREELVAELAESSRRQALGSELILRDLDAACSLHARLGKRRSSDLTLHSRDGARRLCVARGAAKIARLAGRYELRCLMGALARWARAAAETRNLRDLRKYAKCKAGRFLGRFAFETEARRQKGGAWRRWHFCTLRLRRLALFCAACEVQRSCRGYVGKCRRWNLRRFFAARRVQSFNRGVMGRRRHAAIWLERLQWQQASRIQARFRATRMKRAARLLISARRREQAGERVQRAMRAKLARLNVSRRRVARKHDLELLRLQCFLRGSIARCRTAVNRREASRGSALLKMQRVGRGHAARSRQRQLLLQRRAVARIEQPWRLKTRRLRYERHRAARFVQTAQRKRAAAVRVGKRLEAVTLAQEGFQIKLKENNYNTRRRAARRLQRWTRLVYDLAAAAAAVASLKKQRRLNKAARDIQRVWRGLSARRRARRRQAALRKIQNSLGRVPPARAELKSRRKEARLKNIDNASCILIRFFRGIAARGLAGRVLAAMRKEALEEEQARLLELQAEEEQRLLQEAAALQEAVAPVTTTALFPEGYYEARSVYYERQEALHGPKVRQIQRSALLFNMSRREGRASVRIQRASRRRVARRSIMEAADYGDLAIVKSRAASILQRWHRGRMGRMLLSEELFRRAREAQVLKVKNRSALIIQAMVRGVGTRQRLRRRLRKEREARKQRLLQLTIDASIVLQCSARQRFSRIRTRKLRLDRRRENELTEKDRQLELALDGLKEEQDLDIFATRLQCLCRKRAARLAFDARFQELIQNERDYAAMLLFVGAQKMQSLARGVECRGKIDRPKLEETRTIRDALLRQKAKQQAEVEKIQGRLGHLDKFGPSDYLWNGLDETLPPPQEEAAEYYYPPDPPEPQEEVYDDPAALTEDGWAQLWDDSAQANYFYNYATGEASWVAPSSGYDESGYEDYDPQSPGYDEYGGEYYNEEGAYDDTAAYDATAYA